MHSSSESGQKPLALFLMGPTASGKTDLAIELVEQLNAEIISVDSAMVYKGMDIGSAKPSAQELARAPHRLIDICDPADPYSAARFRDDALREMADISSQGKIPLLVGGTMLYYKTLLEGMHNLPDSDATVRARLQERLDNEGLAKLHQDLAKIDPVSANRIHENDPQRTLRALEVFAISGKPLSQLHAEQEDNDFPYRTLQIALAPQDRTYLHQRIEKRFHQMMEQGFLQEVESLYERGDLHPELPSIKSVGYRQMWQYLEGDLSLEEAVERGIIATRQLAKRQFTWLRSWKELHWMESRQPIDRLYKETVQLLNSM